MNHINIYWQGLYLSIYFDASDGHVNSFEHITPCDPDWEESPHGIKDYLTTEALVEITVLIEIQYQPRKWRKAS